MKKAEDMEFMKHLKTMPRQQKVVELCVDGMITDGGHHKQWYLEQILLLFKDEDFIENEIYKHDGKPTYIERGIAP